MRPHVESERYLLALRRRPQGLDATRNAGRQLDSLALHLKLPRQDTRHVEKVVDDLRLDPDVPLERVDGAIDQVAVSNAAGFQNPDPSEHSVHGRAQLVGECSQELVLDTVRLLRFCARSLGNREQLSQLRIGLAL
jgi:hypothetical protein